MSLWMVRLTSRPYHGYCNSIRPRPCSIQNRRHLFSSYHRSLLPLDRPPLQKFVDLWHDCSLTPHSMFRYALRSHFRQPFRLMDLPLEIRLLIYEHVYAIAGRMVVPFPERDENDEYCKSLIYVENNLRALSGVSKLIRKEISGLLIWRHLRVAIDSFYLIDYARDEADDMWSIDLDNDLFECHQERIWKNVQNLEILDSGVGVPFKAMAVQGGGHVLENLYRVDDFNELRRLSFKLQLWQEMWDLLLELGRPVDGAEKTCENIRLALLTRPQLCFAVAERVESIDVVANGVSGNKAKGRSQHFVSHPLL